MTGATWAGMGMGMGERKKEANLMEPEVTVRFMTG